MKNQFIGITGTPSEAVLNSIHKRAHESGRFMRVFSLMNPVRYGVANLFNLSLQDIYQGGKALDEVLPYFGKTTNELMYMLENTYGREWIGERVWVDLLDRKLAKYNQSKRAYVFVISELRTESDIQWIKEKGGKVLQGIPLMECQSITRPIQQDMPIINSKMNVIGVSGFARTGKDTTADYLSECQGFHKIAFATPFKEAVGFMFDLSEDHLYGDLKDIPLDNIGQSPRELMQSLGTNFCRRLVREDIWIYRILECIRDMGIAGQERVIISDVRKDDEADLVRERLQGAMWHVKKKGSAPVNTHEIEQGVTIKDGDKVLNNDGSLDDLYQAIDNTYFQV